MKIMNLTGQEVTLIHPDTKDVVVLPRTSHKATARIGVIHLSDIRLDGAYVLETENYYTNVKDLPEPETGTIYIVLPEVLKAEPMRKDLRIVNEPLYDENHHLIGYQSLTRFPK